MESKFMNLSEVAKYTRHGTSTIKGYVKQGLPCRIEGNVWTFHKDAVDYWFSDGKVRNDTGESDETKNEFQDSSIEFVEVYGDSMDQEDFILTALEKSNEWIRETFYLYGIFTKLLVNAKFGNITQNGNILAEGYFYCNGSTGLLKKAGGGTFFKAINVLEEKGLIKKWVIAQNVHDGNKSPYIYQVLIPEGKPEDESENIETTPSLEFTEQ